MTTTEQTLADLHQRLAAASGQLSLMLAKRRVSKGGLAYSERLLREALADLQAFIARLG